MTFTVETTANLTGYDGENNGDVTVGTGNKEQVKVNINIGEGTGTGTEPALKIRILTSEYGATRLTRMKQIIHTY